MSHDAMGKLAVEYGYDLKNMSDDLLDILETEIQKPAVFPAIDAALRSPDPKQALRVLVDEAIESATDDEIHDPALIPMASIGVAVGQYLTRVSEAIADIADPDSDESHEFYGLVGSGASVADLAAYLASKALEEVELENVEIEVDEDEPETATLGQWEILGTVLGGAVTNVIKGGASGGRPAGKPFRSDWQLIRDAQAALKEVEGMRSLSPAVAQAIDLANEGIANADKAGLANNVGGLKANIEAVMQIITSIKRAAAAANQPKINQAVQDASDQIMPPVTKAVEQVFAPSNGFMTALPYIAGGIGVVALAMFLTKKK